MSNDENMKRFLAISYLYLQLTDESQDRATGEELTELIEAVNAAGEPAICPDRLHA